MPSLWQFNDQGLVQGDVGNAPTYNDVFTRFGGQDYMTGFDPTLAMTLNAGNQGSVQSGIGAFLAPYRNQFQLGEGESMYDSSELQDLARRFGVDPEGEGLEQRLNDKLGDYYSIGGMSAGWNPTGDVRQGNYTLYQRRDGRLVPVQTQGGHLREEGSFIEEHPGVLAPLGVAGAGLLAMYGGYGAGLGGSGAGGAGAGASGAGAGSAASTGISQSIANYLGLGSQWSALGPWGQGAVTGALQGGIRTGSLEGALTGAVSGGLGGGFTDVLGGWGVPSGLASGLGRLGGNLAGGLVGQGLAGSGSGSAGSEGGGEGGSSGDPGAGLLAASGGPSAGGLLGTGVGAANDVRQQILARQMNSPGRAGDVVNDNALINALRQA